MPRKTAASKTQEPADEQQSNTPDVTTEPPADAGSAGGAGDGQDTGADAGEGPAAGGEGATEPSPEETVNPPRHAPSAETSGRDVDTTTSDTIPPGSTQDLREQEERASNDYQVLRLAEYLRENFPDQVTLTREFPEHPVDTAMRLLSGLASQAPQVSEHCKEPYCNKPRGHADDHGIVNYG